MTKKKVNRRIGISDDSDTILSPHSDRSPDDDPSPGDGMYRGFIENLPVLFYAVTPVPPFTPLYVSPAFNRFGFPLERWRTDPEIWLKVIHPEDRDWVFSQTDASTQSGEEVDYEYRIIDANGQLHWVRDRGCLIRDKKDRVLYREGVMLDITDRKKTEEALLLSEDRYRNLFENANDVIYVHDLKGNYISVNNAIERTFGYSREETLGLNMAQMVAPEYLEMIRERLSKKVDGTERQTAYELDCIKKDGSRITVEVNSSVISRDGTPIAVQGIARDVTERKQAETAMRESEAKFRTLAETASDAIITIDEWGIMEFVNAGTEKIFGLPAEAMLGQSITILIPERFREAHRAGLARYLQSNKRNIPWKSVELPGLHAAGHEIQLELSFAEYNKLGRRYFTSVIRDITERKVNQEALMESEARFRDLFENANDLIYTHDLAGNFTSLNRAGERITGYTREEALTMNIAQVVAPDSLAAARSMTARKIAEDVATTYEIDILAKDGRIVSLELSTRLIYEKGKPAGVQGIGRDITERRRQDDAIKASEHRFRQLGEGIFHQVWTAEPDGRVDYVNGRMMEYFARTSAELIREDWQNVVHPDDMAECMRRWTHSFATGEFYEIELRLKRHDGVYRWHKTRATCGRDENGNIVKWYGTNTDIDDQKQSEEKLNYFAKHDPLTDLPNRAEFMRHLKLAIDRADSNSMTRFAVLFLDLDRFKVINDSLGHLVGDSLLRQIADRLQKHVRPGDVVARLGGDEFTILLNRTGGVSDVVQVAERVQRNLAKPFQIDGFEVFTSASIGIIVSDEIMRQPEDFLRDADSAMYRAKEAGKARYEIFDREMHARNLNLLELETDLRHAVAREEFELLYQPIIDLQTGSIREFEALIRWRHPRYGLVGPDNFVGAAEESGLIVPIGNWIIKEACRQLAAWQRLSKAKLSMSVNLSAKQLMHPSLVEQVSSVLAQTELTSNQLKLEVTESTVMEHSERSMSVLSELSRLGVSLSTDDFGTGYSSLSYLRRFPFDRLKIDRSFIDEMGGNDKSAAIVKTILMLGENLGIEVVAEGIETENQLDSLMLLGCRLGQGFLFSRPVNVKEAEKMVRAGVSKFYTKQPRNLPAETPVLEVTKIQ